MKSLDKIAVRRIGFGVSLFLTICSGIFALISLSALVISIIEKDLFSVIASVFAGFVAFIIWDVRRDLL